MDFFGGVQNFQKSFALICVYRGLIQAKWLIKTEKAKTAECRVGLIFYNCLISNILFVLYPRKTNRADSFNRKKV